MKKVKKIGYMIRLVFLEKLAYTKAVWFDIFATFVSVIIYYCLWSIVFQNQEKLQGFTMAEMTTYVILSKVLASQFAGGINVTFASWIYDGMIGTEMTRPVSLFTTLATRRIGEFLFYVLWKALPVIVLGFLLLGGASFASVPHLLLFLCSVIVSIGIMFYIEMLVGMVSFYTLSYWGIKFTKTAVLDLLSGGVIPLFLFPEAIEKVLNFLPFASMVSVPIHIFLGKYSIEQSLASLAMQIFWVVVMYGMAHGAFHHVIKKVIVQGG